MKARVTSTATEPVWCHHCCIRIAPYGARTVSKGKNYHRDCYTKIANQKGQTRKN